MSHTPYRPVACDTHSLSTAELASRLKIRPNTLRAALSSKGHYFGVVPSKAPNRFLLWPADALQQLSAGTQAAAQAGKGVA